jgi:hypothetical protein
VSARAWTRAVLDRAHPLPAGWTWQESQANCGGAVWCALFDGERLDLDDASCFVWPDGTVSIDGDVPWYVALAVILASQGLDSREAMAKELDDRVAKSLPRAEGSPYHEGLLTGYACSAMMLRHGRVQP